MFAWRDIKLELIHAKDSHSSLIPIPHTSGTHFHVHHPVSSMSFT